MSQNYFRFEVLILAPASTVYAAITTPQGLRGWWTATCEVGEGVGARSTFRFGQTYNIMRIESLTLNAEVRWECLDQYHHAPGELARTDEWAGTSVVFRLEPQTPSETLLRFEHAGLVPELDCYEICDRGWTHFLGTSLKKYAETGVGAPFVEAATH